MCIITDNEIELFLDVTGVRLDGAPEGWSFCLAGEGLEFSATVEDEKFLDDVKNRRILFGNGVCIRASVRVVQRRIQRTVTERHITAVREVFPPSGD